MYRTGAAVVSTITSIFPWYTLHRESVELTQNMEIQSNLYITDTPFFSLIYTNVTIPYFLTPEWFQTYFELALPCLDLDLWLANFKICLIFCLGGPGSCSRTVITENTHWAWPNVNFNGVSYKNTSCKDTIERIYT